MRRQIDSETKRFIIAGGTHFQGAIAVTVVGLNLLGDGLRDLLDPNTA